jgi:hypothetical protein
MPLRDAASFTTSSTAPSWLGHSGSTTVGVADVITLGSGDGSASGSFPESHAANNNAATTTAALNFIATC